MDHNALLEYYLSYEKDIVESCERWVVTKIPRFDQIPDFEVRRWTAARRRYLGASGAAHQMVDIARRAGRILSQPCEVCGDPKSEGHHEDYERPFDLMWLCRKHHAHRHTQMIPKPHISPLRLFRSDDDADFCFLEEYPDALQSFFDDPFFSVTDPPIGHHFNDQNPHEITLWNPVD